MDIWILIAHWGARLTLILLFGLSIWSVAIMIERWKFYRELMKLDRLSEAQELAQRGDLAALRTWANQGRGLHAGMLKAAFEVKDGDSSRVQFAVRGYLGSERSRLERGLNLLATLGSNAPFIGLFGTVLGIIQAFGELANQGAGTQAVMAGISEALVLTAVGLMVAIPAVVAYNSYSRRVRLMIAECESLRDLVLSRMSFKGAE